MKKAKKLTGILLLIAMLFMITAPAMATDGTSAVAEGTLTGGKITIKDAVPTHKYALYQILYLESYQPPTETEKEGKYSYKANSAWKEWLKKNAGEYLEFNDQDYVTWKGQRSEDRVTAFAALLKRNIDKVTAVDTKQAPAATGTDNSTVEFSELKLGYYLVDTTLGSLCSLDTTNPTVEMKEKNEVPKLEKMVKENNEWTTQNDANVGDTIEFQATITVQGTAKDYVMHDKMDEGLTFDKVTSVELTKNGAAQSTPMTSPTDYRVVNPATDGDTFDVEFTNTFCGNLQAGDVIVVSYQATLNKNAVKVDKVNNKAHLEYKDKNNESHNTPDSKTETYTWDVAVFKYTQEGNVEKALSGAKFELRKNSKAIDLIKSSTNNMGQDIYRVAMVNEIPGSNENKTTEIITNAQGKFIIQGLDAGTYSLVETVAPSGYNLAAPVTVTIGHDGKINVTQQNPNGEDVIKVLNQSGTLLPSTGGMGTTIFYVLGAVLVVGAGVLLVTKKRMSNQR